LGIFRFNRPPGSTICLNFPLFITELTSERRRHRSARDLRRHSSPVPRHEARPAGSEAEVLGFLYQFHPLLDDLLFGIAGQVFEQMQHAELHASPYFLVLLHTVWYAPAMSRRRL
jgi:hypothetical protein